MYVDVSYYFDWPTAEKLVKVMSVSFVFGCYHQCSMLQFYTKHKPLKCEIDAYGDFLQALGSAASNDYCSNTDNVTCVTEDLVEMRKKVFDLLQGIQLHVVIYNQV